MPDLKTKEEKDAELDRRIEALRKKNEALMKRHQVFDVTQAFSMFTVLCFMSLFMSLEFSDSRNCTGHVFCMAGACGEGNGKYS